jgi:hypothetical protein
MYVTNSSDLKKLVIRAVLIEMSHGSGPFVCEKLDFFGVRLP